MKFQVIWTPRAESRLAELWLKSPDRPLLQAAADRIDEILRRDPLSAGVPQEEDFRIVFEGPLAVRCQVRELDRMVLVFHVQEIRRR